MNFYPTSTTPLIEGGPYESFLDPNIFKWDVFCDHQQNYVKQGGSNHLCLTGTEVSEEMNGGGFIEQPDSVAVRLFGLGYVNSVRLDEERSDGLITPSQATKIERARTSVQNTANTPP